MWNDTIIVPFNDAKAVEDVCREHGDEIAAVILEPVMMNVGIIVPEPGYLQALRDICDRYGVVLIFDEVKCGATIAYGGAIERFGVQPHLAALRQGDRRRHDGRRVRRRGRDHGARDQGRRPAGDVQREPAVGARPATRR